MCGIFAYYGHTLKSSDLQKSFETIRHRGPDQTRWQSLTKDIGFGFHRLAIMDTSHKGDQPLSHTQTGNTLICNGEIYNYTALRLQYEKQYSFLSHSDCEVLLPLFEDLGFEAGLKKLDAEFVVIYFDKAKNKLFAARDPMGIRPLFYGYTEEAHEIVFASEAKALTQICSVVLPFPPGCFYDGENFKVYKDITVSKPNPENNIEVITQNIREKLSNAVIKRLQSDVSIGFLLSGGVDSSLVCAIAAKHLSKKIQTFAVGCHQDAIDIKYAQIVANHIGSHHHTVYFSIEDVLAAVKDVIYYLESWDVTTIRASIGMYLVSQYVRHKTDIKVLLTGEVSDELFGYKYTDFAPSPDEFQKESLKRIHEIHLYDVLRADRSISAHSLEARVPFGDLDFVDYVLGIDPSLKMNTHNIGKYLLRKAFEKGDYLPKEILLREKAAFSDAVGHSVVDNLKIHADSLYSDADLKKAQLHFEHCPPHTKEALYYREIFEKLYPDRATWIPSYWLPNTSWPNCNVNDPSARHLPNYGASGH